MRITLAEVAACQYDDREPICFITGCTDEPIWRDMLCRTHYERIKRHGNPHRVGKPIEYEVDANGCFICISHSLDGSGYARMLLNGKLRTLHRLIYEECFGEIPANLLVRHKCDVRNCINPEHLELGTPQDNMNDKVQRGRARGGKSKK